MIELMTPGMSKLLGVFSLVHKESDPVNFSDPVSVLKVHYGYSNPKIWENTILLWLFTLYVLSMMTADMDGAERAFFTLLFSPDSC